VSVATLASAKIGIFACSIIAGVGDYLFLRLGGDAAVDTVRDAQPDAEPNAQPDAEPDAEASANVDAVSSKP
jgi:hypothetical protein